MKRTILHQLHIDANAKMMEYQGWQVPCQFTDLPHEYQAVRSAVGLFDVSCLGRIEVSGPGATALLQSVFTRNMSKVSVGTGQYGLFCNENGGIIEDCIVFHLSANRYFLTTNAGNTEKVFSVLKNTAFPDVQVTDKTQQLAQFALQGPRSVTVIEKLAGANFKKLSARSIREMPLNVIPILVSRSGYTGEQGYELFVPVDQAASLWKALLNAGSETGLLPCGFVCRDVLRLEMGYRQYGNDINETRNPWEAGLGGLLDLKKDFTGKEALLRIQAEGTKQKLTGFVLLDKSVPKTGGSIFSESSEVGIVTSSCYSPHRRSGIGMGYVVIRYARPDHEIEIEVRDKEMAARTVELPFYLKK